MSNDNKGSLFSVMPRDGGGPAAPATQNWWKAQSTTAEPSTEPAPPPPAPQIAPPPAPADTDMEDSAHRLVVPNFNPRRAAVGPVVQKVESQTEQLAPPPPRAAAAPAPAKPAPKPVQKSAAMQAPPAMQPAEQPAAVSAANDLLTLSMPLLAWVAAVLIAVAGVGGLGFFLGVKYAHANAAPAVAANATVNGPQDGPANPNVLDVSRGGPPLAYPSVLPHSLPALQPGKKYLVIREGITAESEAAATLKFLDDNAEKATVQSYEVTGKLRYRVVSLRTWVLPRDDRELDAFKLKIEKLGEKFAKVTGQKGFAKPYLKTAN